MKSRFFRFFPLFRPEGDPPPSGGDPAPAPAPAPPSPTPTPPPPSAFGTDGSLGENWWAGLGDEFAPHAAQASQFKNVGDLFKSYTHLRGHGPAYPGEDSSPDDVARFRALAQVPENPQGYGIAKPETLPDGVGWDQEAVDSLAAVAHKHHVPMPALQALLAEHMKIETGRAQGYADAQAKEKKAGEDALVAAWRGDFNENASTARHYASKLAESAGIKTAEDPGFAALADNPTFARMMLQMSKMVGEDPTRAGNFTDMRSAQQRADAIMNGSDPEWGKRYTEGTSEERAQAYQVVSDMLQKAAQ